MEFQRTPNSQDNTDKDENKTNLGVMTGTYNFSAEARRLKSSFEPESHILSQIKQKMLTLKSSYNPAILLL